MAETNMLTEFGKVLIFIITGLLAVGFAFFVNKLIAPHKPNPEKNSSYECGEETIGNSWIQFNSRFYVIALIFLLFDVEMVFVFPWATIFADKTLIAQDARWGWLAFTEMLVFIGILLLGLVYVWKKKDLEWIKPSLFIPKTDSKIPLEAYQNINKEKYIPFKNKLAYADKPLETEAQTIAKPKFTPRFKKA
ncbi:NADH-quinone oxidoreductase subunit A [Pedobacter sp. SD-b]|uniref:NADH-quinone oxidoreductase subunit A n=1 Tax=Pedobacter segetis TaxID=2793069 RepID=A0ABS1BNB5_9SPHI|nr:NADH-quinone oxidoreductase subunit A [Pedobacter segetis]MBK0384392.1 NADH-quinone oxidoreductase subunit A [Pedobacter segetis]